ncbi:MAG: STAS domain-containing protein [Neisseriaceae bacterium]|nr:STAS domain-containing protein [Neisseriaceae bacterium]
MMKPESDHRLPPFVHMLRGYTRQTLRQDVMAGLSVGMIAVPLSMALAIGTGVPPQHGLYTAIVAGFLIALLGGSRFNVSGPTAAFVVILQPIVATFGLGGLLTASFLAGWVLILMGVLKLGRLVYWVPEPVISGFSTGIAVVIVVAQVPDFLGLPPPLSGAFMARIDAIVTQLAQGSAVDATLGLLTLAGLLLWPLWRRHIPPHLAILTASALLGAALTGLGWAPRTIASVFAYSLEGVVYSGIPPMLPTLTWPWLAGEGSTFVWTGRSLWALAPSVLTIAFLGAVESLLCAVVADGMTKTRHRPNAELVGQGLGNVVAPLFGGFAATGALARTAANIRAGAKTPVAAMIHALFVLLSLLLLAPLLGHLPMASLAALLCLVAWHMANVTQLRWLWRLAPWRDRGVWLLCFGSTVLFGMVVGVLAGLVLAAGLLGIQLLRLPSPQRGPSQRAPYAFTGPLFFGVAQARLAAFEQRLAQEADAGAVVLECTALAFVDLTGLLALQAFVEGLMKQGHVVVMVGLNSQVQASCRRARLAPEAQPRLYWVADGAEWRHLVPQQTSWIDE